MAIRMRDAMFERLDELRYEPIEKRVRALLGDDEVVDSSRPLLVWEPRRVVPSFAVPIEDVRGELVPAPAADAPGAGAAGPAPGDRLRRALDRRARASRCAPATRRARAWPSRPPTPTWPATWSSTSRASTRWLEEDEPLVGHARDPYHRIDMRRSSRPVRIERDGALLAQSTRAVLLWETSLPTRFYLPREDVVADARPSDKRTTCAYKGHASYCPFDVGENLAWTYEDPLPEAAPVTGPRGLLRRARRRRPSTASAASARARRSRRRWQTSSGSGCGRRGLGSARWRRATCNRPSRRRRRRTGSCSQSASFDWLCEQGHVGLERVAKARRDPAIVAPVIAALEQLAAIYARLKGDVSVLHAARENLLLPVELVHAPTGTVIEVDEAAHFTSFRLDGARALPRPTRRRVRPRRAPRRCAASGARGPTASTAGWPPRASASAGASASAPTTTRCATSPCRPWATRRCIRIAAVDGDGAAAYARHREALLALSGCLRLGSCSSVAETLIVEQRPHLTRTL